MKISLRFTLHLIFSLLIGVFSTTLAIMVMIEVIFPVLGVAEQSRYYDISVITMILFILVFSTTLFGRYFGKPLISILTRIQRLAKGEYEQFEYRNGNLQWSHKLYGEVFESLEDLAAKLKQAEAAKEEVEKLKQEWAAGISHDLKTPLTYINGYSALLLQDREWSAEEKRKFLTEIHEKGLHMEELIKDLSFSFQLSDSKIPALRKQQPLIEFIRRLIADILNSPHLANNELSLLASEQEINLWFDEKLLYRALQNLYMNAILHNPEKTAIDTRIEVNNEKATIIIKDHGSGMDSATVEKIFTRYYRGTTTDTPAEGTGLGMVIAHLIIVAHQGSIHVESEPQVGTTITIGLPLAPP